MIPVDFYGGERVMSDRDVVVCRRVGPVACPRPILKGLVPEQYFPKRALRAQNKWLARKDSTIRVCVGWLCTQTTFPEACASGTEQGAAGVLSPAIHAHGR